MANVAYINRNLAVVRDADFKYTTSPARRNFVRHTYPIIDRLISLPSLIPWHTYEFEGVLEHTYHWEIGRENHNVQIPTRVVARYNEGTQVCSFFGGCCYEILHNQIKNRRILGDEKAALAPPLRDFLDPTGDVDVHFLRPPYNNVEYRPNVAPGANAIIDAILAEPVNTIIHNDNDYTDSTFTVPNALIQHWTAWIHAQVVTAVRASGIAEALAAVTEETDYRRNYEGSHADLAERVGNIWVLRTFVSGMAKIQLLVKYNDVEESDHMLEFVHRMNKNEANYVKNGKERTRNSESLHLDGLIIQGIPDLIQGNLSGLTDRASLIGNINLQHKFYNHIGRLQYLNHIVPLFFVRIGREDGRPYLYSKGSPLLPIFIDILTMLSQVLVTCYDRRIAIGETETITQHFLNSITESLDADPLLFCKFDYRNQTKTAAECETLKLPLFETFFNRLFSHDFLGLVYSPLRRGNFRGALRDYPAQLAVYDLLSTARTQTRRRHALQAWNAAGREATSEGAAAGAGAAAPSSTRRRRGGYRLEPRHLTKRAERRMRRKLRR